MKKRKRKNLTVKKTGVGTGRDALKDQSNGEKVAISC
jgi:hypothetical protein